MDGMGYADLETLKGAAAGMEKSLAAIKGQIEKIEKRLSSLERDALTVSGIGYSEEGREASLGTAGTGTEN